MIESSHRCYDGITRVSLQLCKLNQPFDFESSGPLFRIDISMTISGTLSIRHYISHTGLTREVNIPFTVQIT